MEQTKRYIPHTYDTEARRRRDALLVALYLEAYSMMRRKRVANPRKAAVRWVLRHGQPRYHVGYMSALRTLGLMAKGLKPCREEAAAYEMWHELRQRVDDMQRQLAVSRAKAVEYVLEHCRASRFFIKPHTADLIIRAYLKKHPFTLKSKV